MAPQSRQASAHPGPPGRLTVIFLQSIMPYYEYYSPDTHKIYTFFARRILHRDEVPKCPDGPRHRMEKMVSRFAITKNLQPKENGSRDDAGELRPDQEAAMMNLAREMEGMSEENPDPRQLGHLMRRMSELTGEKVPAPMEEMIKRMEAGEDPEKLEAEYGDQLDDPSGADAGGGGTDMESRIKRARRLMTQPRRDPVVYEAADYL